MVHGIGGDADVGFGIMHQYQIATVRIAGAAREVATGDVDLNPAAGAKRVMDMG